MALERFLELVGVVALGLCAGVGLKALWVSCTAPRPDVDDVRHPPSRPRRITTPPKLTTREKSERIH